MIEEMWKEMIVACFNMYTCLQLLRKITEIRQVNRCSDLDSNQAANETNKYVGPINLWPVSFRSALRGFVQAQYIVLLTRPVSPARQDVLCRYGLIFYIQRNSVPRLWCVNYEIECDIKC
jgi:hypothetical protein